MAVMVTGGAGYIGSHVVRLLKQRGDDVVIVDDMSNGVRSRVEGLPVVEVDLASPQAPEALRGVFADYSVDSVIHFAAKKQVGESVERPLWYYQQNVGGLTNLLQAMEDSGIETLVFSSSAAVYGMPDVEMVRETTDCHPINPYGHTKLIGEWLIDAQMAAGRLSAVKLRYFNVAGTGWSDLADTAVMNLIPIVLNRFDQGQQPVVFGDDYDTPDGTCIRDYIHVADLAEAHISALDYLKGGNIRGTSFNVGTGTGASVLEVIDAVSKALGEDLEPVMADRRAGDPPQLIADPTAINADLAWKAQFTLDDIARSAVESRTR